MTATRDVAHPVTTPGDVMPRMDDEDRKPFADAIARATSTLSGPDLDTALAEIGWHEALPEYAADAVAILFENQGRARATTSALDVVLTDAAGVDPGLDAVVLPAFGTTDAPGNVTAGRHVVRGLTAGALTTVDAALVFATVDGECRVLRVETTALQVRPAAGIDPTLGLARIDATELPDSAWSVVGDPVAWDDVLAAGQRALAHELIGLSRTMLELAREHALAREQFGRPISAFQAVRHRLAESLVAIEAAESAAVAAWDSPGPMSARIAKAMAGQSGRTVARHAQQVLAGMGFTTEHAFHLYFKRTLVLDHLLGSSRGLTEDLGRRLLAARELPDMLPL